jgi:four helix bundle protein
MQDPKNLAVSNRALELALAVYRLTRQFPTEERFGLTAQMRRAAVSVGSNIAEGCGRWGNRELLQFLHVAYSSAAELAFQLSIATQLDLGQVADREHAAVLIDHVQRMLNRLMVAKRGALKNARSKIPSPRLVSREP